MGAAENRAAAKSAGDPTFIGEPCSIPGHGNVRRTSNRQCVQCESEYGKRKRAEYAQDPEWVANQLVRRSSYDRRLERERRYERDPDWKKNESRFRRQRENSRPEILGQRNLKDAEREYTTEKRSEAVTDAKERRSSLSWLLRETLRLMGDAGLSTYSIKRFRSSAEAIGKTDRYNRYKAKQRRALRRSTGVMQSVGALDLLKLLQNGGCAYCGKSVDLHLDHIQPLTRGGRHEFANLQWLCSYHNISKHAKLDAEYRVEKGIPALTQWDREVGFILWFEF